jgi:thioredoxin 1
MASPNTLEFTDANFETEVLKSPVPVLVDFWAEWCQPCRMLGPTIEQIAEESKGKAKVGKINIDHHQNVAMKFGIQSIPTILLFKQGQMVKKWVGTVPKATLSEAVNAV